MSDFSPEQIEEYIKRIESASFGMTLTEQLSALHEIKRLQEVDARNEIFERCLYRAGQLWHEKHPNSRIMPDGAVNIAWLIEEIARLQGEVEYLTRKKATIFDLCKSTIERRTKKINTLRGLVGEVDKKAIELQELLVYSREGSSHGVCSPAKETDILNGLEAIRALIARAEEAAK